MTPGNSLRSGAEQERRGHPTQRASLRRRVRYRFDNTLAHGPLALIGWLAVASLAVLIVASAVATLVLGQDFLFSSWRNLLRVLGKSDTETDWPGRILGLAVLLFGLFVGGAMIGHIAAALSECIRRLGLGRGPVV